MQEEDDITTGLICSNSFLAEGIKSIAADSKFKIRSVEILNQNQNYFEKSQAEPQLVVLVVHENMTVEVWRLLTTAWRYAKIVAFVTPDVMTSVPLAFLRRASAVIDRDVNQRSFLEICQLVVNGTVLYSSHTFDWLVAKDCLEQDVAGPDRERIHPPQAKQVTEADRNSKKCPLSPRELRVLECLVSGSSNKVIARQFNLAESTVKIHVRSILRKLQTRNRTQAALWALENGITSVVH